MCNVHVSVDLWMVGFRQMPHSNQNTQANIEFYHGALKHWFLFDIKGFKGCHIDWLVWRFITIMAQHYMHQAKMKKCEFVKNNVVQWLVAANVYKARLITHIDVIQPTLESEDNVNDWNVKSQTHLNVIYNLNFPFIEYASCTYEWVLRGNFCKHQAIILLACTDLTIDDIYHQPLWHMVWEQSWLIESHVCIFEIFTSA